MDTNKKRYKLVFTGIFLVIIGGLIYYCSTRKGCQNSESAKGESYLIRVRRGNNIEDFRAESLPRPEVRNFRYKSQPLNFVYEAEEFEPSIPHDIGLKRGFDYSDLDGLKVVCGSKMCDKQVLTAKSAKTIRASKPKPEKVKVVNGSVLFSKDSLKYLQSNVRVMGDLYIRDIDFLKIPKNFSVMGNVYITNSEGVTFMGGNFIDGHIFVRGKSSVRALPYNVKLTGQIFI
ncbi:MAG: hypothetical protein LBO78_01750 [Rickettsiales bacterium]|jgi:hypothetical protein|nr:hypothetical protein [Rickettsiales bacterium]